MEIAKYNNVKGMVYLSSMEVYGCPKSDLKISEDSESNLNTMSVRSSYPISKRVCENLCASYAENIKFQLSYKINTDIWRRCCL